MSLIELLEYARDGHGLLTTAQPYLREMQACLSGDGSCPAKLFSLDSADQWKKMIDESADRLIYCDPQARVKSFQSEGWNDDEEIPQKSIFVYDAILSTSQKDRDGDIMHPEGMRLQKNMPLLWQHVWAQPIGVMVKQLSQDTNEVTAKYAIADTDLGRDAATLVSMGALRKSHGFLPVPGQFEVLGTVKRADGKSVPTGFRIKEADVFESSLVSVPSNAGATILRTYEKELDGIYRAVSEKKLRSDVATHWAKGLYDKRTKVFAGADFESRVESYMSATTKALTEIAQSLVQKGQSMPAQEPETPAAETDAKPSCGCGTKEATPPAPMFIKSFDADVIEKSYMGMPDALPGSFEQVQREISRKAEEYLKSKDVDVTDYDSVYIVGTFADSVVLCIRNWRKGAERCYRLAWSYSDSGEVTMSGDPEKVEIQATVTAKALRSRDAFMSEMTITEHANSAMAKCLAGHGDVDSALETFKSAVNVLEAAKKAAQPNPLAELFG